MAPAPESIRVIIADDHKVVRAGVRAMLNTDSDIEVVGEAEDGTGVVREVRALAPDVVLLDVAMPGPVATRVSRQIRRAAPATSILVFSAHEEPFYIHTMLEAGALGYLSKRAPEHIADAIRTVHRGERYLCTIVRSAIGEPAANGASSEEAPDSFRNLVELLSAREREVLVLLALGHTYREVARKLGIGTNSVGTYRARLSEKLGATGRNDLVRICLASGLLVAARPS